MEDDIEFLIPYFFMRDSINDQSLCLKVFINRSKYPDVRFEIKGNEIFLFSRCYKQQKYCATIWLPIELKNNDQCSTTTYEDTAGCYKILIKKVSGAINSKLRNLDLITKFLAWRDENFEEEPDTLMNFPRNPNSSTDESVESSQKISDEDSLIKPLEKLDLSSSPILNPVNDEFKGKTTEYASASSYGFASRYRNVLSQFEGNWQSGIELENPEESSFHERFTLSWEQERQSFNVEHYLADYFLEQTEDGGSLPLLFRSIEIKPYWHCINKATEKILKPRQMLILAGLPNKNFSLNSRTRIEVLHSLLDIILAFAYDYRITEGKHNSESAWNINKLSSTLSWFQVHKNAGSVVTSFFRRSLSFPLLRFWFLSTCVFYDALEIFHLGRRQLLNCLVTIYEIFEEDDDRKILNELYIEDYMIWVQQVHPCTIKNYIKLIESCIKLKKEDVFSVLPTLESEGKLILCENPITYDSWKQNIDRLSNLIQDRELNTGEDSSDSCSDASSDPELMDV